jgi:CHRD domain
MKRVLVVLALALAAHGCSSDDSPTSPSPNANTVRFTADLSALNETPPVTGAESSVRGTAVITFNLGRDAAGTVTSATALFEVGLTGIPAGSAINIAHIHPGRAGVAGSVLVNTGLAAGQAIVTNGTAQFTKADVNLTVANAQAIMADPAGYYFNVHSAANPSGVARGQLVRQ